MHLNNRLHTEKAQKLLQKLKKKQLTLSTAESCTGGLLSALLTEIPGSSSTFKGGICAYSHRAKTKILQVPQETLTQFGAVSEEVASSMADNIRKILNTSIGVSITGIAGPGGQESNLPVGFIWYAISTPHNTFTYNLQLEGHRQSIRQSALIFLLDSLSTKLDLSNGA